MRRSRRVAPRACRKHGRRTDRSRELRVGSDAGVPTWTYDYYEYRVFGESNSKDLVLRFSADSTVKSYALSTTFPEEKKKLDPAVAATAKP